MNTIDKMRFTCFFIFLMVTVCHLACQNTTKNSNSEKVGSNQSSLEDTSGTFAVNLRGDSISYINWAGHVGAVGVMQVLPNTAASPPISIPNVRNPENNIHAGVKYMRYLIDNYFVNAQIDSLNMHLMALAAYNCGPGNMRKLRRESKEHGLNENVWFNNVEIMAARHIGRQTVQYVSNIYRYYWSYQALQHFKDSRDQKSFQ